MSEKSQNKVSQQEIDKVINAFFGEFDNRNSRVPDFAEFGMLFTDTSMIYKHNGIGYMPMSVEHFIDPRAKMLTDGTLQDFHEWEVEQQTIIADGIATRVSRYAKAGLLNGEDYQGEGVKHIQLLKTDNGWKIVSVIWVDDL